MNIHRSRVPAAGRGDHTRRTVAGPPLTLEGEERPPGLLTIDFFQALTIALLIHMAGIWLLTHLATGTSSPAPARRAPIVVEFAPARRQPVLRPFKFVDIPDEPEVRNPDAPAVSDRSRRARAPLQPPPAHRPENEDPYALGNSPERIAQVLPETSALTGASKPAEGASASAESGAMQVTPGSSAPGPGAGGGSSRAPGTGSGVGVSPPGGLLRGVPRVSEGDLRESFHNPGGVFPMDVGTVSFDTAAIDWGPYAREMLKIIRYNWREWMPPAAYSGLRGVAVVRFRIARDGSVSGVALVDSYGAKPTASGSLEVAPGIRPFEVAAQAAVQVSELPPLPDIFTEPDVGVTIGFFYNLRPPR